MTQPPSPPDVMRLLLVLADACEQYKAAPLDGIPVDWLVAGVIYRKAALLIYHELTVEF